MLKNFNLKKYHQMLLEKGVEKTWSILLKRMSKFSVEEINDSFLKLDNLGELYEYGLALEDKIEKNEMGKYYTPNDVSKVMSQLFLESDFDIIADVACGTGNLICELVNQIKNKGLDVVDIIKQKKLYLYDIDKTAMDICVFKINKMLNQDLTNYIIKMQADFLDQNIVLPENCSIITNPPYKRIRNISNNWNISEVMKDSKELYSSFLDKMMDYAKNIVIVSPQSFLVSDKYYSLRKKMNSNFTGEIFSFDNVPGNLFNGRKHGIFNTNSTNSVRASISKMTRINGGSTGNNFRLTKLIRFSTSQRSSVVNIDFLKSVINAEFQNLEKPAKFFNSLEGFAKKILDENPITVESLLDETGTNKNYKITISTSSRYFVSASKIQVKRIGFFQVYAKDEESFFKLYSLLNSSYFYMWWRFYDGGITFSRKNFIETPIPKNIYIKEDIKKWIESRMLKNESDYLVYKVNAGKKQESVKFPSDLRFKLNEKLFDSKISKRMAELHRNREDIN